MSRWIERFQLIVRGAEWDRLQKALEDTDVDAAEPSSFFKELARLRKVIAFVDGIIDGLDPELLPLAFFDVFNHSVSNCAARLECFRGNRNLDELYAANNYADEMLSLARPYLVLEGRAGTAFKRAAIAYSRNCEQIFSKASQSINESIREISGKKNYAVKSAEKAEKIIEHLEAENDRLFGGDGVLSSAEDKAKSAEEKFQEIRSLHQKIFNDLDGAESVKSQVEQAAFLIYQKAQEAIALVSSADHPVKSILEFQSRLMGDPSRPEVESISGFIENKQKQLLDFEGEQKKKINALVEQIEDLIPGATSAGLASAYREMRESFDRPIQIASNIFYLSIAILMLGSFLFCIHKIYWFGIDFVELPDWQASIRSFAYKLPFYVPVVWLAYYASKRRSEFQRLQQEYAHKEALAKSYDSFRRQIEDIGTKDDRLMAMLLEKAIGAIARNASQTLDGKHGDKAPAHDAVEKLLGSLSGIKDLFSK